MNTEHTPESFAAMLHGREYGEEITREESALAKANGLVVVYGYSDYNCELEGAISAEVDCFGGGKIQFLPNGKICQDPPPDEEETLEKYGFLEQIADGVSFFMASCREDGGPAWTYKASFPHATFDIMEYGEVFCRGMVFRLADAFKEVTV